VTDGGARGTGAQACALTAAEMARLVAGDLERGEPQTVLRGAAVDSRLVAPGMVFIALRGANSDGHRFVAEAVQRGAAGALVSQHAVDAPGAVVIRVEDTLRAFHRLARGIRDRQRLRVVGITGSVGKTSTKEMAATVAARVFRTVRSPENWNTEIGVPLVLANMPEDREVAVLEMAMRGPGQIRELVEVAGPEIGVVTNIGESHMDFFPSREALAAAKGELIEGLPANGCAVLNAEDALAWGLRGRTRARVLSFGLEQGEVRAETLRPLPMRGSTFRLKTPNGDAQVTLRLPGRHSVRNALAAAAAGLALGIDVAAVAAGLAEAAPLPMRLEVLRLGGTVLLSDVYNSSPQSVAAALDAMDEVEGSPRVVVLGDMRELGTHAVDAHRRVGQEAAGRRIDLLVAFGPLASELAAGAREVGGPALVHTERVEEVVDLLYRTLVPGAVVLIKGSRAMAMERITAALMRPEPTGASGRGGGA
jgi:UDP-N-acetylmuramoyl-tripeptide--D-alanyl-D-alanine ligase